MQYGKLENGEVIYYQKPENILCEDPTLRGYKELGHARGVAEFNTRATGRTTGIAFSIIGQAMCNPGQAISYRDVDHTFHEGREVRTPYQFNKNFESELLYKLRELKGFVINPDRHTIQYNPIVTEGVYVE